MEREFQACGCQASEALIFALIKNNNGWAHAVLSQCFSVPNVYTEALLSGEAVWKVPNKATLIIGLAKA